VKFPTLYHKGKSGATWQWKIWTEGDTIFTEHGQIGGALQRTPGIKCEAKNVGRANETSPKEQADREAKSMWTNKVERKYSETVEDAQEEVFLPMLAHPFKDPKKPGVFSKKAKYPLDIQPKLDGARAMAFWDGDRVVLGTRGGKEWEAPVHIIRELEEYLPKDMVLDGELYIHGVLFEDIASWTKKIYPETARLEYHVYDMPLDENGKNHPWETRYHNLAMFFAKNLNKTNMVKFVKVVGKAKNAQEVLDWEDKLVEQGYEGAMGRNANGLYLFGHRSHDLLKVKSSMDDEFKIVGFTHGVGKFEKSVIWECVQEEGRPFEVVPKTTQEKREEYYRYAKQYVGQWCKVRYQNRTKENKPRFPRGIGIRDPRDMDAKKKKK
jgi:DNA ligase-1